MKGDFREAMRIAREQREAEESVRTSVHTGDRMDQKEEAHWERLHAQMDSLPWRIVGVQILIGFLLWALAMVFLELRGSN